MRLDNMICGAAQALAQQSLFTASVHTVIVFVFTDAAVKTKVIK